MARLTMACLAALAAYATAVAADDTASPVVDRPNILVLLLDDVGVDKIGVYGEHPDAPPTPNIDHLASTGVLFRRVWSNPNCSPTRASLLTGRYAFRHGIGQAITYDGISPPLSLDETLIPEVIPYRSAALGKWHLMTKVMPASLEHPLNSGFDVTAGAPAQVDSLPGSSSYEEWIKNVDGTLVFTTTYATTDTADDTITAMHALLEPWFVYSCFNAAHKPLHVPPAELHTQGTPVDDLGKYDAMVEALDTEIGRILDAVDPTDTVVILLGDNGTIPDATTPPFDPDHAKSTPYEGGVRVPLVIAGPGVGRGECRALVQVQDLFPTIIRLAGEEPPPNDGVALQPYLRDPTRPSLREWIFTERFKPNGNPSTASLYDRAIRDGRYKIVKRKPGNVTEFFDLAADQFEQTNLLDAPLDPREQQHFDALSAVLDALIAESQDG